MDRLREERERSLTIEVSSWAIRSAAAEFELLDAPGHRKFLKNMSTGAAQADFALLMVSAAPGEFERGVARGGQTRLEALLAFVFGVRHFVVGVNKLDLFAGESRKNRFEEGNLLSFLFLSLLVVGC